MHTVFEVVYVTFIINTDKLAIQIAAIVNVDVFGERVRNKSTERKFRDPAGIRTQDLLKTSQTLLPLSHSDPWHRSGRQAT